MNNKKKEKVVEPISLKGIERKHEDKWVALNPESGEVLQSNKSLAILFESVKNVDIKPTFLKVFPSGITYSPNTNEV